MSAVDASQCQGKHAFDSFEAADRARPPHRSDARPFRCTACGQWHLGGHAVLGKKRGKGQGYRRGRR